MTDRNRWYRAALLTFGVLALHPERPQAQIDEQSWLPPTAQVEAAIKAQPLVTAAAARVDAAAATQRALAAGSHEFELSAGVQSRDVTDEGRRYEEWEIGISRALRWPDKARLDREIGSRTRGLADMRVQDTEHQIARRLLELWSSWVRSSIVADEMCEQDRLLGREQEAVARRVALGDAARRDSEALQAERSVWAAQVSAARDAARAARQTLRIEFPDIAIPTQPPALPDPRPLPGDPRDWRARIVQHSVAIRIADGEAGRLAKMAERARVDRTPDPTVGVHMTSERGGSERIVGVVVTVPFGTGYRSAMAATESANASVAEAEAAGMRRAVEREAWDTVLAAGSKHSQWLSFTEAVAAQTIASNRTRRAWELGEAPLAEYLLALRNLRQVKLAETQARVDALTAAALVRIDARSLWHVKEPDMDTTP